MAGKKAKQSVTISVVVSTWVEQEYLVDTLDEALALSKDLKAEDFVVPTDGAVVNDQRFEVVGVQKFAVVTKALD